jgi:YesN/AraC family two-component response regulator
MIPYDRAVMIFFPPEMQQAKKPTDRLLIVEDDDEWRQYISDCLIDRYEVFQACNGKEGWDKVLACHPDLVITDIKLPVMDGIKLSRKIKADKRTRHLPVILLTGLNKEEEQLKGLRSGANDYLVKPCNVDILAIKIKNLLALHYALKEIYSKRFVVQPADVEIKSGDDEFINSALRFIENNIQSNNLNVLNLSTHLKTSRVALYNRIFKLTGMPPVEFIRSFKLNQAAGQLINTDKALALIARATGFATAHYFSKSFKGKFGLLPSEYRSKYKNAANN